MGEIRFVGIFRIAAACLLGMSALALACPRCRTTAAELETESMLTSARAAKQSHVERTQNAGADVEVPPEAQLLEEPVDPGLRLHGAIGIDFTSAYIYQGYVEANRGVIAQPYLTLSTELLVEDGFRVEPYVSWVNTLLDTSNGSIPHQHGGASQRLVNREVRYLDPGHPGQETPHYHTTTEIALEGADGKQWYDSKVIAGAMVTVGDLSLDFKYHVCFFPDGSHDAVQELGARLRYDLAGLWTDAPARRFSLVPFVSAMWEIKDDNGEEQTYIEYGIEPQWRVTLFDQQIGVSIPLTFSASPDGYFFDEMGEEEWLGAISVGPSVSWKLPIQSDAFRVYLNASLRYYDFSAYSSRLSNGDDSSLWVGTAGVSIAF